LDPEFLLKFNSLKGQCEREVVDTLCIGSLKLVYLHHRIQDNDILKAGCRGFIRTNGTAVNFKHRQPKPNKDYTLINSQYELVIKGAQEPEYDRETGKSVITRVNGTKRFINDYSDLTGTAFSGSEFIMSEVFEFQCGLWESQQFYPIYPIKEN